MYRAINRADIPGLMKKGNGYGKVMDEIRSFLASGLDAAEIDHSNYKNVNGCCSTYKRSVKLLGADVEVFQRHNRVFMVKKK